MRTIHIDRTQTQNNVRLKATVLTVGEHRERRLGKILISVYKHVHCSGANEEGQVRPQLAVALPAKFNSFQL